MSEVLDLPAMTALGRDAPEWRKDGACHEAPYGIMWHPDHVDAAKRVCARCLVREDCLKYALTLLPPLGVWGGLTWDERLLMCPACRGPKERTSLACCRGHEMYVIAGYLERQLSDKDPEFRVSKRTEIHPKTNPDCGMPHGGDHGTFLAYRRRNCRCEEGREKAYAYDRRTVGERRPDRTGPGRWR